MVTVTVVVVVVVGTGTVIPMVPWQDRIGIRCSSGQNCRRGGFQ